MSDLAVAWLVAALWATVALLRAIELGQSVSVFFCALGVCVALLQVGMTWRGKP